MAPLAIAYPDPDARAPRHKRKREAKGYRPLDERLAAPGTRILRSLRWGGPADFGELMERLDVAPAQINKQQYDAHAAAMARMLKRREVRIVIEQRRQTYRPWTLMTYRTYQITSKGKRALERALRPDRKVIE